MKKAIAFTLILLSILSLNAHALSAKSAVLIDAESGRVLYEYNAYEKLPMASTTKIMTGLLACESKKLKSTVKVSPFASSTEGSSLWLKIGEEQTLENLTYGLMLKSGNDAAVAIAEHLGGNIEAFAVLMNKRAKEIGALNTSFKNPHGLDAEGHFTTAFDLAQITRTALNNKTFSKIVATKNHSIPMEGEEWNRALKNHNKMLWMYEGCNGVKTGFTKKCGRCLVTSAQRDGENLICVTLNAPDDWNDHTQLLNKGFSNFENTLVFKKGEVLCYYLPDKSIPERTPLTCEKDFTILMCKGDTLNTKIEYLPLQLPVKKGTAAAIAHIYCNGEKAGEVTLLITRNIKKPGISGKKNFLKAIFG